VGRRAVAFVTVLFLLTAGAAGVFAQGKGFGAGAIFGEPTGVSLKYWLTRTTAVDAGLAWSFKSPGFFHIHADYLWHFRNEINSTEQFVPYLGVGGRIGFSSSTRVGARMVGGIGWWPHNVPLDIFAEVAPILDLVPKTEFSLEGGIGLRYFF